MLRFESIHKSPLAVLILLLAAAGWVSAGNNRAAAPPHQSQDSSAIVQAPGWTALRYSAPVPGTYELPAVGDAADGLVLDSNGHERRLYNFFGDKMVVLSFIYRSCPDPNGCPLAIHVLNGLQQRVLDDAELRGRVRLVSMSFDPQNDRPADMRSYGERLQRDGSDWQFLTTDSDAALAPILAAYGQTIRREQAADGHASVVLSHILRVYLIDRSKRIRNIYSSSFLHADTLTSDIKTLLLEQRGRIADEGANLADDRATQLRPGDDKRGYERDDYETHSLSVAAAHGADATLLDVIDTPPLGLPRVPVPADSPINAAKVELGRKLFYDRRLSRNDTISCAMCHIPAQGFTSNEIATAVGIEGRTVRRNAPTIYNSAYANLLFHDGRETRLEQQVWGPLLAANEMGNPAVGYVLNKLAGLVDYAGRFEAVFDGRGPTMETLGMALACYERTLVSANSAFDRWRFGGDRGAITPAAERGFGLFSGKAGCTGCHQVGAEHALFTDQKLHNTGIGYRQTMRRPTSKQPVQIAPGTFVRVDPALLAAAAERPPSDLGQYEISGQPRDRWKYKTPSLRNVALTAPYMHDGSLATLRQVVEFYDAGGVANPELDPAIKSLGLRESEKADLVAFLESLTGSNVDVLVADALAVPIGDPR